MGQRTASKLRSKLQGIFFKLGCFSRRHCWAVLAVGFFILIGLSVGIITARIETDVEKLWMEVDGRLEKELKYTKDSLGEGSGTTNELLIHAVNPTNEEDSNILTVDSLQRHLKAVQDAVDVKVDVFGKTWTHTDLCYVPQVPSFNISLVDGIISAIIPCLIISPLDCFWDGAKLLKLRAPLPDEAQPFSLEWTESNPSFLLTLLDLFQIEGSKEIKDLFVKAGINKGYQEKPCLDPTEAKCPQTAPNSPRNTGRAPNVKKELTGGCKGFATEFMQWAEELIVGGTEKSNNTLISAKALQTILVLTGPQDLYKRWADKSQDLNTEWNIDAAKEVLETWQRSFTKEINQDVTDTEEFNILAFDSASITDLLKEFSETSVTRIAIGYALMVNAVLNTNEIVVAKEILGSWRVVLTDTIAFLGSCLFLLPMRKRETCERDFWPSLSLFILVLDQLVYACITLKRWCEPINSHGALGFAGVLLVTLSVAAGLGFSALCGITFNAASTQVLPFLALGLGVDDMFLLAHSYSSLTRNGDIHHLEEPVGYCLGTTGVSVFLTSFTNMLAFFMAALIPIPALRYFAIQAAVVVIFNFIGVIIIFPALIGLDLRRRENERYDIICCIKGSTQTQGSARVELPTENGETIQYKTELSNSHAPTKPIDTIVITKDKSDSSIAEVLVNEYANNVDKQSKISYDSEASIMRNHLSSNASQESAPGRRTDSSKNGKSDGSCTAMRAPLSLQHFATVYYGPFLQKTPVKAVVILFFLGLLAVGIYGAFQVEDGLELTDVVPSKSVAHKFVEAQFKYFSFYPMALVTQDEFDYAYQQKKLYSYHEDFKQIPNIIRIPDSEEIPRFWMMYFRDWLNDTQTSFDQDWAKKTISYAGWKDNASSTGVMAYKLLAQNDSTDKIDRSKVRSYKLVSEDGIIRPEIFYKALTIWVDRDVLGYAFAQADIKPETVDWSNTRTPQDDDAMRVPAAKPITFAKINFNVIGLKETKDFVKLIKDVREICDKYSDDGLPNYPSGVPFTFWEQYIWLGRQILIAISISLGVTLIAMATMLFNIWAAAVVVLVLIMITVEVYGFMGLAGIKLSAVPAVTLILSVGVGVEFTVHMCMAFLHSLGDRNQRMQRAIEHVFVPIVDGAISTFLGVVMLAGSEFQFIVRYFFNLLVALILIGTLNGVVFLPVFLSLAGPGAAATEVPTLGNTSNSLAIQNPSSAESAINALELEENNLNAAKNGNEKPNDQGSVLERTYQNIKNGSQVEPSDNEPRIPGVTTDEEPDRRQHLAAYVEL